MATVGELYDFLQWKAPFQLQMDFDNAGLLVGRREHPVERVLIALDITGEVIQEAIEVGAQLIVSHHPMIWGGAKTVTGEDVTGRRILTLAGKAEVDERILKYMNRLSDYLFMLSRKLVHDSGEEEMKWIPRTD